MAALQHPGTGGVYPVFFPLTNTSSATMNLVASAVQFIRV